MKTPPPKLSALLAKRRAIMRELKALRETPPQKFDPVEVFCRTLREGLEQDEAESTEPPASEI
jgi:hypothetical protein